jgi:putative hemolysin
LLVFLELILFDVDPYRSSFLLQLVADLQLPASPSLDAGEMGFQITVIVISFFLSAIFSGSEVAFFSIKSHDLSERIRQNDSPALRRIQHLLEHPRQLLSTILIGNTVVNILISVFAAVLTGNLIAFYNWPPLISYAIEIVLLTSALVIFGEISPKVIGLKNPYQVASLFSRFIYVFYVILKPLNKLVAASSMSLEKRIPKPKNKITGSDLMALAEVGEQEGQLREDEREIIENVIEFGNTEVREIMTSRVDIESVSIDDTLGEVLERVRTLRLSRLPLCDPDLDSIAGIIYAKDLLTFLNEEIDDREFNWKSIARKALFIPVNKKLDDLLEDFQREKTHMAIVVDEFGGTEGLVTLDDVLEEIMGELETDPSEQDEIRQLRNGDYIIDARVDLDELNDLFEEEIATDDDEYETLGGLVYHILERIPSVGEKVRFSKLEITVHELENNRVKRLRVRLLEDGNPEVTTS